MSIDWLDWSNPVAIWWVFLVVVSATNIALWAALYYRSRQKQGPQRQRGSPRIELMILLCAVYVFGCAFRSVLPRADVERICLFDTWLSSVLVGRSVATVAEVCFVAQWAIVLRYFGNLTRSGTVLNISRLVLPMILLAEFCSWYAVVTTSYLGNTVENSIWAVTFLLIAVALLRLRAEFRGIVRLAIALMTTGIAGYLAFLVAIDVPMYFGRWLADQVGGKPLLGLSDGLHDVATHWVVTRDFVEWREELAWMALYFSAAVWSSLMLCGLWLVLDRLPRYRAIPTAAAAASRYRASSWSRP